MVREKGQLDSLHQKPVVTLKKKKVSSGSGIIAPSQNAARVLGDRIPHADLLLCRIPWERSLMSACVILEVPVWHCGFRGVRPLAQHGVTRHCLFIGFVGYSPTAGVDLDGTGLPARPLCLSEFDGVDISLETVILPQNFMSVLYMKFPSCEAHLENCSVLYVSFLLNTYTEILSAGCTYYFLSHVVIRLQEVSPKSLGC